MAEDSVKRVTGPSPIPLFPSMSDMSSITMPFSGSPSDATSDAAVVPIQDDPNLFFQGPHSHDRRMNTLHESIPPSVTPIQDVIINSPMAGGKMARSASMQRVASLEHLQKRICGTPSPCASGPWDSNISGSNKKHNRV